MAIQQVPEHRIFTCDGCGATEQRFQTNHPDGWKAITVLGCGDFCGNCVARIDGMIFAESRCGHCSMPAAHRDGTFPLCEGHYAAHVANQKLLAAQKENAAARRRGKAAGGDAGVREIEVPPMRPRRKSRKAARS